METQEICRTGEEGKYPGYCIYVLGPAPRVPGTCMSFHEALLDSGTLAKGSQHHANGTCT
jgi:hypothetical protein